MPSTTLAGTNAMSKLRPKELTTTQTLATIACLEPANAREETPKTSWTADLQELKAKFNTNSEDMMHNISSCKALSFHDHKLKILKGAADQIDEVDSLLDKINAVTCKRNKAQQMIKAD